MQIKNVVSIVLILFVAASAAFLLFTGDAEKGDPDVQAASRGEGENAGNEGEKSDPTASGGAVTAAGKVEKEKKEDYVIVYYFHTTKRCPTCLKIEKYTRESIESNFSEQLENGRLEFRVVDLEEGNNIHFVDDYRLTTKSVVLSSRRNGEETEWKNLEKVWDYTGDRQVFIDYIRDETRGFLGELAYE